MTIDWRHTAVSSPLKSAGAPVVIVWQSLVASSYRGFFVHLREFLGPRLQIIGPRYFRELGGQQLRSPEASSELAGWFHTVRALVFHTQVVIFLGLRRLLRTAARDSNGRPVVVAMAEPYSITALWIWVMAFFAFAGKFHFVCFGLQNISKPFVGPIAWTQAFLFRRSRAILVCGLEQRQVLRSHGYEGEIVDFPLWYDEHIFRPQSLAGVNDTARIGYAGGLLPEKGITDLFALIRQMPAIVGGRRISLELVGAGPMVDRIKSEVLMLNGEGITAVYHGAMSAAELAKFFGKIDILVVPSLTMAHWKEQFGRVIVEARACGALVIGSDSGEIPNVIGESEWIFREGDLKQMAEVLTRAIMTLGSASARELRDARISKNAERFASRNLARKFSQWVMAI